MVYNAACPTDGKKCGNCGVRYDCILQQMFNVLKSMEKQVKRTA